MRTRACVRRDRCDRCGWWSGTARCCCGRGQTPTCHWSVLMLTQGSGCTHPIDRKMAASRVCRWRLKTHLFFPPSALFASLSPPLPPSIMSSGQNTKKPLVLSCLFSHIFAHARPLAREAYIYIYIVRLSLLTAPLSIL